MKQVEVTVVIAEGEGRIRDEWWLPRIDKPADADGDSEEM